MIDLDFNVLENSIETTRKVLGESVISIDIWDKETGLTLVDWHGNPTGVALLSMMTVSIDETLLDSDFPRLHGYFYLDLQDNKAMVVINHGDNILQGWLLDGEKVNPAILLGMAIPKAIESVTSAR